MTVATRVAFEMVGCIEGVQCNKKYIIVQTYVMITKEEVDGFGNSYNYKSRV